MTTFDPSYLGYVLLGLLSYAPEILFLAALVFLVVCAVVVLSRGQQQRHQDYRRTQTPPPPPPAGAWIDGNGYWRSAPNQEVQSWPHD